MKTIKKIELRARTIKVSEQSAPYGEILNPSDVVQAASQVLDGEEQEVFLVFMLNIKNKILGFSEIARGSVDACPVDPRAVFRTAVLMGASGVILAHCHPSGDPTPSQHDIALTTRLMEAGNLLGIKVLDHVIIAGTSWISLEEKRLMQSHQA